MKSLNQWLIANKISLIATMTGLNYFRNTRNPIPNGNLILNGVKIQHFSQIKCVGITFDGHLTFKIHLSLINSKFIKG